MLLSPKQAAEYLGVKTKTLTKWRGEGRGPAFRKIEGVVRYHPEDVERFGARDA